VRACLGTGYCYLVRCTSILLLGTGLIIRYYTLGMSQTRNLSRSSNPMLVVCG
jgi:hypothetical protein